MRKSLLESLTEHDKGSLARRLARRLPEIEEALSKGFRHKQIHEQLVRDGLALSLEYYLRLITRLRREARFRSDGLSQVSGSEDAASYGSLKPADKAFLHACPQGRTLTPPPIANPTVLDAAFNGASSPVASNIDAQSKETTRFKFRGEDMLTKDWSKF